MNRSPWTLVGCLLLAGMALGMTCSPALSTVIHVRTDGNDSNDGLTWETAMQTIQAGLDAAGEGDEVWVAAGVYLQRTITMPSGPAMDGGFDGTETERERRDWEANVTILDSNHAGRVLTVASSAGPGSRIDGFTIRNGDGDDQGGGIHCGAGSPTITNNTIVANEAWEGGGVWCSGSPTIASNTISANWAASGGGIYSTGGSPTISNNLIKDNTGPGPSDGFHGGGGIRCAGGAPAIFLNWIEGNYAKEGGGILCGDSAARVESNVIIANTARPRGGGIRYANSTGTISNNVIVGNEALYWYKPFTVDEPGRGGGVHCSGLPHTIVNNTIVANSVTGDYREGGGINLSNTDATVENNIIAFGDRGVYRSGGWPWLRNNCVYGNTTYDYSGIQPGFEDISQDPMFVDVASDNYHVRPDSPCIDAGDDAMVEPDNTDMDGEPRIWGAHVDIGADEFVPQLWFEDDDSAIAYTGAWSELAHPAATAGHISYSDETAASAALLFYGTGLRWHLAVGPMAGMADVYLDGGYVGRLDLYRPRLGLIAPQRTGLALGPHTILIEVSGEKDPNSSGYYVDIDAFEVVP